MERTGLAISFRELNDQRAQLMAEKTTTGGEGETTTGGEGETHCRVSPGGYTAFPGDGGYPEATWGHSLCFPSHLLFHKVTWLSQRASSSLSLELSQSL